MKPSIVWASPFAISKSRRTVGWLPSEAWERATARLTASVVRVDPPPFGTHTVITRSFHACSRLEGTGRAFTSPRCRSRRASSTAARSSWTTLFPWCASIGRVTYPFAPWATIERPSSEVASTQPTVGMGRSTCRRRSMIICGR